MRYDPFDIPETNERDLNSQIRRATIVSEENGDFQHRTDPESSTGDWSGWLSGSVFPREGKKSLV